MTGSPDQQPVPFGGPGADVPFDHARVAILPVPFEATVSYGTGTRQGPGAILDASSQVELYDEQLRSEPYRCGIWTDAPLELEAGDLGAAIGAVGRRFGELTDAGKWVLMLGGEHSITSGAVAAAAARHERLTVVQLDAHADLRERYEGTPWNHACAMARAVEHAELRAVGIRNYSVEEAERIATGIPGYRIVHAWEMDGGGWQDRMLEGLDGRPVYLTVDVDYFDPGLIPTTGTPEPGGGAWWPTLAFLARLFGAANVVGADIVELAPQDGLHHADFTAARLAYKLIGMRFPELPPSD